jgi:hypothetical protein
MPVGIGTDCPCSTANAVFAKLGVLNLATVPP